MRFENRLPGCNRVGPRNTRPILAGPNPTVRMLAKATGSILRSPSQVARRQPQAAIGLIPERILVERGFSTGAGCCSTRVGLRPQFEPLAATGAAVERTSISKTGVARLIERDQVFGGESCTSTME